MNLREIIVSMGCCAAAIGLGFGKPARAGELRSSNETIARGNERCAVVQRSIAVAADTAGCEQIVGHVRVDLGSRSLSPSGYSPVAVRMDDGTPSRSHLRLPPGDSGPDSIAR